MVHPASTFLSLDTGAAATATANAFNPNCCSSWSVFFAKFFPKNSISNSEHRKRFKPVDDEIGGTWVKSRERVLLTVVKRVDSRLSTLSIVDGEAYEEHYVSRTQFFMPVATDSENENCKTILAAYFTPLKQVSHSGVAFSSKVSKFAVHFESSSESRTCFSVLQKILEEEKCALIFESGNPSANPNLHLNTPQDCCKLSQKDQILYNKCEIRLMDVLECVMDPKFDDFVEKMESMLENDPEKTPSN